MKMVFRQARVMLRKNLSVFFFSLSLWNCMGGVVDKGGNFRDASLYPSATILRADGYKVLGEAEGESSAFYLLGLIPVTSPINIDYALSQAVQVYPEGGSMVNMRLWTETHYFFPVGKVLVLKVKGDVIDIKESQPMFESSKPKIGGIPEKQPTGGISVGGKKKPVEGGISVGGKK